MFTEQDSQFMQQALLMADKAAAQGEIPVGAVLVQNHSDQVVVLAASGNQPVVSHDPTAHAEIVALRAAGARLGNYRLPNTTLYVTLEPCPMCLAALFHARVSRVVFGASDPKTGACGGAVNLLNLPINHHTVVQGGLMADDCAATLQNFFKARRAALADSKKMTHEQIAT